ncbi:hypothetical protein GOP47_0013820 [Adiantum capillus-veneris]|uniref:HAT C-terminal dimerisation domain-containing protein n=1 Tax=Adiantum capillus-veneris TaxID=13818 RepID=A0A9D4UP90_ADICA|nr:hypothetical protein GOP47_0013820 [Adiantum capillus-veneris]
MMSVVSSSTTMSCCSGNTAALRERLKVKQVCCGMSSDRFFKNDLPDYGDPTPPSFFPVPRDFLSAALNLKHERLYKLRDPLLQTVVDPKWRGMSRSQDESTKYLQRRILDESFWQEVHALLVALKSVYVLLRLTDMEGSTLGLVYHLFMQMKDYVSKCDLLTIDRRSDLLGCVESRWTFMSRTIYAMAAMLHSLYRLPELWSDTLLSTKQSEYVGLMFSEDDQLGIDKEFTNYMNGIGASFTRAVSLRKEATKYPLTWWHSYGRVGLPNLSRIALRILSQDCSAGACERNWSAYSLIHTKIRNRLSTSQLEKLVYCRANMRLVRSYHSLGQPKQIVEATWSRTEGLSHDLTFYTGVLGTAFLCFKSFERAGNNEDVVKCLEIVKSCTPYTIKGMKGYVTFLCGRAGNYALGAVAAKYCGNDVEKSNYVKLLQEMAKERSFLDNSGMPDELLYGRVGFLWACLFVNKYLGDETISWSLLGPIVQATIASGRAGARRSRSPLMYEWHGKKYWGAAHGLAGIMHVLMHFPLSEDDANDVKGTLHYMIANRLPSGNYPAAEGDTDDRLVHWCHGAPGVLLTLCKAAEVFPSDKIFKEAAVDAGEVVWRRGLLKRLGVCHGISGNAYAFLALYRLTGDLLHLHRARAFSTFLHEHAWDLIAAGKMHGGDRPLSLFEGSAGLACLWFDIAKPEDARFPAYEL